MNSYSYQTGPWDEWTKLVDDLLGRIGAPHAQPRT
jgi:hypothetical protein